MNTKFNKYSYDLYMNYGSGFEYVMSARNKAELKELEATVEDIRKHDMPYPYTIKKQLTNMNTTYDQQNSNHTQHTLKRAARLFFYLSLS